MRVAIDANCRCQSIDYSTVPSDSSLSGNRRRPIPGEIPHRGLLLCIFARPIDSDWRHDFGDLGRCDPAFAKHAPFVIARSDSDEAIQSLSDLLDCFASLAMTPNHPL
jgi:hypothetical protein